MGEELELIVIAETLQRIERRLMDSTIELTEAVTLFREVIYSFDPLLDPTWPLRSARLVHAKVVRSLKMAHSFEATFASKMSLCAWFQAWRLSEVLEQNAVGHRLRFLLNLLQITEITEVPRPPRPLRLMEFVSLPTLHNIKTLLEVAHFEELTQNVGAMLELQTIAAKHSDDTVFIYIWVC